MALNKKQVEGLLFYFENSGELDPGIQEQIVEVLEGVIEKIEEEEAAKKKKRKSPNRSGILQVDPETGKIVGEFESQKAALAAIGKEGKSGVGDALNGRTKSHKAYSYEWWFKDEFSNRNK